MSKVNKVLIGLLAAQLLLTGYLYRPGRPAGSAEVRLLADFTAEQVQKLVISELEQRQVVLLRAGDGWLVELAPGLNYPADAGKIDELLARLVGLHSDRLVSRTRGGQHRLKVAAGQYNRKLELYGATTSRTLFLGGSPSYQTIHARAGESDEVYLVRDLALWEVPGEAAGWWQGRYLDQDPGQLLTVELHNSQGRLQLQRRAVGEPWRQVAGQPEPDAEITEDFLAAISQVTINEVVADPAWQPTGQPVATLRLRNGGGEVELQVWPRPDENSDHPIKVSGSAFYGRAGSYAVAAILDAKSEDLRPGGPAGR